MEISVELGIVYPALRPVLVRVLSERVGMQVRVKRRHAGDGAGRDRVLLASVRVVVYNRDLGGDSYLSSHHAGVQANGLLDDRAQVWEVVNFRNRWDLASLEARRAELGLKFLRFGRLGEEVVERAGECVCCSMDPC